MIPPRRTERSTDDRSIALDRTVRGFVCGVRLFRGLLAQRQPPRHHVGVVKEPPHWEIRLLGRFAVTRNGQEIPPSAFGGRLVRVLVRVLITRRGTFVSKDVLAEALWPERPPADPGANLEVLVSRARRGLGDPSLILTGSGGYAFAEDQRCSVDTETLLGEIRTGLEALAARRPEDALRRLRGALDLWGGEPLAEDAYSDWSRGYRESLARARIEMLEGTAVAALACSRPDLAVSAAEHAVAAEPLRETSNLLLVRALAASGDAAAALGAFETFRARLVDELGIDPSPDAVDLHLQLLRGEHLEVSASPPPSVPLASTTPAPEDRFVGRDRELGVLSAVVGAQGPAAGLVIGPSGSGKSRLLTEAVARSPVPVVAVRAYPPDQAGAWGLARTLLTEALTLDIEAARAVPELAARALAEVVPDFGELRRIAPHRLDARSSRALVLEGAVRLLEAVSPDGALLVVDDLQWADASSVELLGLALTRVRTLRFLGAYRPEDVGGEGPAWTFLARLAATSAPSEVRLGPIPADTVEELVRDVEIAGVIVEGTDLLPITVLGVLRDMAQRGAIETTSSGAWRRRSDEAGDLARSIVAEGQQRSIRARAAALPPLRRRIMNLLSLLGREAPAGLLAHATAADEVEVLGALDRLARGLMVRLGDGGWAVIHDRVAQALVGHLSAEERAPLHAQLARALQETGADPAELARHLLEAGEPDAASRAFARAARAALDRYANAEAEDAARAGLALPVRGRIRFALLETRAEIRAREGNLAQAQADLREALATEPASPDRARLLARTAMLASGAEDLGAAGELAELALMEAGSDPTARARALTVAAIIDLNLNELERSEERFEEALGLFREIGDARGVAGILDGRAMATFIGGRVREAVDAFERAARLLGRSGQLLEAITPRATRAYALVMMDRPQEGLVDAEAALDLSRVLGHAEGECYALTQRTTALAALGRGADAIRDAEGALTLAERLDHQEWTALSLYCLGLARQVEGDGAGAEESYRRGLEVAERIPIHWSFCANRLARVLIARGDLRGAERLLTRSLAEGPPLNAYEARLARAEMLTAQGDPGSGEAARDAIRLAEEGGYLVAVPRLRELAST